MSKQTIRDLRDGDFVSSFFQLDGGQLYGFKNKPGKYALLNFSDRTGDIRAVCWEKGEHIYNTTEIGSIVYVEGRVVSYQEQLQINVEKIKPDTNNEYDPADFLPMSDHDPDVLFRHITDAIDSVRNPFMKELLKKFYEDPEFVDKFKRCPAAKSIHHNYIGGLLEHTSNCARIASCICEIYPALKRDLLLTGTMLHDIGKTRELSFDKKIDYTDEGRLTGHLVIGERMLWEKMSEIPDFPEHLQNEILHLILSHHGENSTGSPKRPKMAEACALHFLENLDAQTKRFLQLIDPELHTGKQGPWTSYDRLLERYIYRGYPDDDAE